MTKDMLAETVALKALLSDTADHQILAEMLGFPAVEKRKDTDRTRWWKLRDEPLIRHQGIRESELASLETAIMRAHQNGSALEVHHLESIRDRMLAGMAPMGARSVKHLAKAALEARGVACRPGPRARTNLAVLADINEALKTNMCLEISYKAANKVAPSARTLEPYGLLFGIREYLLARDTLKDTQIRRFRLDRIKTVAISERPFVKDPDFNLQIHCAKAFGSYYREEEYGPVVWQFSEEAAKVAREFEFHPEQITEDTLDGGLIVRFCASGWLEIGQYKFAKGSRLCRMERP
jgi:predicted DNA-binding transcriptional regulator YafY